MLNYIYINLTVGTTVNYIIDVPYEDFSFDNHHIHYNFLCIAQSVYDSKVFIKFLVEVDRTENQLILHMNQSDSSEVIPGRYTFNLLSSNMNHTIINKITEGIIYFQSSPSQEFINIKYE